MKTFSAILLCGVSAHNWLEDPLSYNGNKASQAMPCPAKTADYVGLEVKPGTPIPMKWTTNHGGTHWVKAVRGPITDLASQLSGAEKLVEIANPGATYTLELSEPGEYVVQYGWSGYYNCFNVSVLANAVPADPCEGGSSCVLTYGRHSSCINSECVCDSGYQKTQIGNHTLCLSSQAGVKPTCSGYCRDAMDWCIGSNAIYSSMEECLSSCATFPVIESNEEPGVYPVLTTGNSLNCRIYHLHVEGGSPKAHCPHASYDGFDADHCSGDGSEYLTASLVSIYHPTLEHQPEAVANRIEDWLFGFLGVTRESAQVADCATTSDTYECSVVFSGPSKDTYKSQLHSRTAEFTAYVSQQDFLPGVTQVSLTSNELQTVGAASYGALASLSTVLAVIAAVSLVA